MSVSMHEPQPVIIAAIIGMFSAVLVGITSYFGGRGAQHASQQTAFNGMAELLLESMRAERDHCEEKFKALEAKFDAQEQFNRSLIEQLLRSGLEIIRPVEGFLKLDNGTVEKIDG